LKWHQLLQGDPTITLLHRACRALHAAEDLWVEEVSEQIYVDLEESSVYIPTAFDVSLDIVESVRERYEGVVDIRVGEPSFRAVGLSEAYLEYVNLLSTRACPLREMLRRLTRERGREHALIIFLDHEAGMVLEGEGDRIVLPELRSCVFIHTHPGENCFPSPNDIKSSVGFFTEGGIVEEIVSSKCRWLLWRSWLLGEEDVEALFETTGLLERAYRGKTRENPFSPLSKSVLKTTVDYGC